MITTLEFNTALKLISDYKLQIDEQLLESELINKREVNIQNNIKKQMFFALQHYYKDYYGLDLNWNDLIEMDVDLLKKINFKRLGRYRGIGLMSINNFMGVLVILKVISSNHIDYYSSAKIKSFDYSHLSIMDILTLPA